MIYLHVLCCPGSGDPHTGPVKKKGCTITMKRTTTCSCPASVLGLLLLAPAAALASPLGPMPAQWQQAFHSVRDDRPPPQHTRRGRSGQGGGPAGARDVPVQRRALLPLRR